MSNNLKIISDPVHGFIKIPYRIILDVIEHSYFQRLKENLPNWVIEFDFPGATLSKISSRNRSNALMFSAIEILLKRRSYFRRGEICNVGDFVTISVTDLSLTL